MMRCINADKLIMKDLGDGNYIVTAEAIVNARTFEAEPVRHGHWIIHNEDNPFEIDGECSICAFEQAISKHLNYCPNCGAKMKEEVEEAEPIRHGHWIKARFKNDNWQCTCSICGGEAIHPEFQWDRKDIYSYCPNCGARMDGDE